MTRLEKIANRSKHLRRGVASSNRRRGLLEIKIREFKIVIMEICDDELCERHSIVGIVTQGLGKKFDRFGNLAFQQELAADIGQPVRHPSRPWRPRPGCLPA
ncbi:MAG: hypothetical protein ABI914_00505 [Acidobacteriota bacterium]